MSNDAPGMKGERARDADGQLRRKRGDTLVRTIEEHYDRDFGVRGDMHLETLLKQQGAQSLSELLGRPRS
jgi:hypothetical protein